MGDFFNSLLSVNAVELPGNHGQASAADELSRAVNLDMAQHWSPTAQSYFGQVTKAKIVEAVREAVSEQAADNIATMKKGDMADAAERLVSGTGWLPEPLRLPNVDCITDKSSASYDQDSDDPIAIAAES